MEAGLKSSDIDGLRTQFGFNEILQKKPSVLLLLSKHLGGVSAWMLELTIIISFVLHKNLDAYVILGLLGFNVILGFFNELKSRKTVDALQKQLEIKVRVLRDNEWTVLPSRDLLPGDVLRIRTGDFLAADLKIIEGSIKIDNSSLTGETELVVSNTDEPIYAGAIVKEGECTARVTATGKGTYYGKTVGMVLSAKHKVHLESVIIRVVRMLFLAAVVILGITTVVDLINGNSLLSALPLLLILLVSAIPIGLPAMFTISMARGSAKLAKDGLLVTKLSATEDAATLTTLCMDKTGTITKNQLSIAEVCPINGFSADEVTLYGSLCSMKADNDPIDQAFLSVSFDKKLNPEKFQPIDFIPFDATRKRTESKLKYGEKDILISKGAFNTIKLLCKKEYPDLDTKVDKWAKKGFKTIAVATKEGENWEMTGIVALYDAPREDAAEILVELKNLGITVKMLTGDALPVGKEIAAEVGIGNNLVSVELIRNQIKEKVNNLERYDGFAEVLPEDKFNLVKLLQQKGNIVGMTGDGVNDAPSLSQAEVGIAVKNATDVAKQAASVVLLKDGLKPIYELIKMGRTIHARIVSYTINKIAKTIQTILFVCVAFLLTGQFVVSPLDMVILLFLIDFVVLSLAVDKVLWSKKPLNWDIRPLAKEGIVLGVFLFLECLLWFFLAKSGFDIDTTEQSHSLGFACLFYSSLLIIPVVRTDLRFYRQPFSKTLLWVLIADVMLVTLLLMTGFQGMVSLPVATVIATILYFLFCNLIINDFIKLFLKRTVCSNN